MGKEMHWGGIKVTKVKRKECKREMGKAKKKKKKGESPKEWERKGRKRKEMGTEMEEKKEGGTTREKKEKIMISRGQRKRRIEIPHCISVIKTNNSPQPYRQKPRTSRGISLCAVTL